MRVGSSEKPIGRGGATTLLRGVAVICLGSFFFLAMSCVQTKHPEHESSKAESPAADSARITQIDDAKIKQLLKPTGKPLLVNFWATWCGPCREEFPDLVKIDGEYRGKIDFITVSLDFVEELNTGVPKFLSEMNAEMPTYLLISSDENTLIPSIAKDWNGALPFTILYNEKGETAYLRQGKANPETLRGEIEKVLDAKE
ncbi:MAG TPA: thioredoxin domain-containing protein [Pyrinomonadaceae bacterium]|nr:thioredoxin domain-containing protein [Pyrinomonadaceae bacterium]